MAESADGYLDPSPVHAGDVTSHQKIFELESPVLDVIGSVLRWSRSRKIEAACKLLFTEETEQIIVEQLLEAAAQRSMTGPSADFPPHYERLRSDGLLVEL